MFIGFRSFVFLKKSVMYRFMPQFDFYSYSIQIIWLFIFFIMLYGIVSFYYLPAFSEVLKIRKKLLFQIQKIKESGKTRKVLATECIKRVIKIGNKL